MYPDVQQSILFLIGRNTESQVERDFNPASGAMKAIYQGVLTSARSISNFAQSLLEVELSQGAGSDGIERASSTLCITLYLSFLWVQQENFDSVHVLS